MNQKIQNILHQNETVIQFITTMNADDKPIYVYLMLSANKWQSLAERMKRETVDFSEEGTILAYGSGHEPDEITKATIQKIIDTLNG